MVDLSKAFNRVEHSDVITILHEMGTPGWLLNIVISFLSNRKLKVRLNGKTSSTKDMPGGGPQGTILVLLIFIIVFNMAGNPSSSSSLGVDMSVPMSKRKPMENKKCKYVDDLTLAKSINLNSKLRIKVRMSWYDHCIFMKELNIFYLSKTMPCNQKYMSLKFIALNTK